MMGKEAVVLLSPLVVTIKIYQSESCPMNSSQTVSMKYKSHGLHWKTELSSILYKVLECGAPILYPV